MTEFLQIAALCVIGAVLSLMLKKKSPAFSYLLTIGCCTAALGGAAALFQPVLQFFTQLQSRSGLSAAVTAPLLKTVAIGLISQIAAVFCLDAGQQSLAKIAELCGGALAMAALMPLAQLFLQTMRTLMGG